jgi:hypothetical protein
MAQKVEITKLPHHCAIFKLKRNEANIAMMNAKSTYFETLKEKLSNPNIVAKQYWHLIKSLYDAKVDSGIPSIIDGNEIISVSKEKAELFNRHFLKKSTLPYDLPALPPLLPNHHTISNIVTDAEEVEKIIKTLNCNKASGHDNIGNTLLKNTARAIAKPLATLFNKSLNQGVFPLIWNKAHVAPVFKQNDKQNKSNYRPISLLSNIGKVFERVVFKHLYSYCMEHNLLTWRNSRYKPLDSGINQLIYISHKIYKALETGDDICLISLDASAAFDRVWHAGLLFKLQRMGVVGKLFDWLRSYLTDRLQRVTIKG